MSFQRILITGIKGGTGKSLIAYLLLQELLSKKVLLIDLDNTLTVSRLLGIADINDIYYNGANMEYWSFKNVSVFSLGVANPIKLAEFQKLYTEVVKEYEIVILDSSNVLNPALEIEARLFPEAKTHLLMVTTPQSISLKKTMDSMSSYSKIYPVDIEKTLLVINMARDNDQKLPVSIPYIIIPFIRELFLQGPLAAKKFPSLLASIRDLVHTLTLRGLETGEYHGDKRDNREQ